MPDEREELLGKEIANLDEQTRVLAEKLERLVGVDCSFGSCVFDPSMTDLEDRIAEVQERKKTLEKIISDLESCER
jgi:chaperonin cofactor prefoldin